jgi:phage/plasmid-associated DNA primase
MSTQGEPHAAITFIKTVFGASTTEAVYCCSLANEKGDDSQAPERSIMGRDLQALEAFVNRWDRDGRGCYFCISTIKNGTRRRKEFAMETSALNGDIDFKSVVEDRATIEKKLAALRYPPSIVVMSGHGLHAYWLFKEGVPTQANMERLETAQRQLADMLGGDLQVAQVVALMRLPGTHNTKSGQSLVVTVLTDSGLRYELDDIEEWLAEQSPIVTRKVKPPKPDRNPFTVFAEMMGIRTPIDVEERLNVMAYQGAGDASIHATQLAVSSSLISRGYEIDDVVESVIAATRAAAGDYGQRWNWRREEQNVRRMCSTWLKKISDKPGRRTTDDTADVVNIGKARAQRAKPEPKPKVEPEERRAIKAKKFHVIAKTMILNLRSMQEDLLICDNGLWHYAKGLWSLKIDARSWLQSQIERTCRQLTTASDNRLVNEARAFIERDPDLIVDDVAWDGHGMVPVRNGLIDPATLELTPANSGHRTTWCVNVDYDPEATCPAWLQMLDDAFADRPTEAREAVISTLQECLGAALLDRKPRGLHKALILYGGPNSGKSQILAVFAGLLASTCISTPLSAIDGTHGLEPFQRRLPWLLNEAFDQHIWHISSKVKTIITGETISINIKFGPTLAVHFTGPIFWATNHPPQFKESTRAIIDRLVVIECRQHFTDTTGTALLARQARFNSPSGLVLARERAGVLSWALAGLQRAWARQEILIGTESQATADQIYQDSNLVAGFVAECTELDPDTRLSMPDFCVAVTAWFAENKGENRAHPSNDSIGRALVALHDPRIATDRQELRDNSNRYVIGLRLNQLGLDYHERGITADLFEGKTVLTTTAGNSPNRSIPASWVVKPMVVAMRAAHAMDAKRSVTDGDTQDVSPGDSVTDECHAAEVIDPSSEPRF